MCVCVGVYVHVCGIYFQALDSNGLWPILSRFPCKCVSPISHGMLMGPCPIGSVPVDGSGNDWLHPAHSHIHGLHHGPEVRYCDTSVIRM